MAMAASTGDQNKSSTAAAPAKGRTNHNSATFVSSGNPCLDFFFHVVPKTCQEDLNELLEGAWDEDPLKALKLVANLRAVRGTGKSDKESFYNAALWLHKNHPRTLAANVASFADLGCFKDLLEILSRSLKEDYDESSDYGRSRSWRGRGRSRSWRGRGSGSGSGRGSRSDVKLSRKEQRIEKAKKVVLGKFNRDPNFKLLHECVSDVFAQCLRSDMKKLDSGDLVEISTAAKWCPSLDDSEFDTSTLLCESIAKKVFPREEYNYAMMDRLKEQVLVPLRKAMHLPEVYIKANDWHSLPYDKVASEDMISHKQKFLMHDKKRFQKFLARVKSGDAKMVGVGGALFPQKIIKELHNTVEEVGELQWKRMVEEMGEFKLKNCLPICDVSSNVREMSLALGVLVSELNQGPWEGKLLTFGKDPKLHLVKGESLSKKMECVRRTTGWGVYDRDLQKVFDVLLEVAVKGKLRSEDMVKRVFIFSDMGFRKWSSTRSKEDLETDYEKIQRKFRENGYGDCVPEMVFWNLSNSRAEMDDYRLEGMATPVLGNQPRVALVSGYSQNLLTLFSKQNNATLHPEALMEAAISGEEYQSLLLVD